ncbi:MAG: hypothetical protein RR539_04440 [Clostridium sp.]|uniref:hypothetical protein n=1 Tax=Clostridium sp. TaxID=1506 RepID=UPI002FC66BB5
MKNKLFWTCIGFLITVIGCILLILNYNSKDFAKKRLIDSIYQVNSTNINQIKDYTYTELNSSIKSKIYPSINSLEEDTGLSILYPSDFKSYEALFIKHTNIAEIYLIPKGFTSTYNKNLDVQGVTHFLSDIKEPYAYIRVLTNSDSKSIQFENLMDSEFLTPIKLSSSKTIQLIKDYSEGSPVTRYILLFNHNNLVYKINNIPSIDDAKQISSSFSL